MPKTRKQPRLKDIRLREFALTILPLCIALASETKAAEAVTLTTVASDLSNPRGLAFGADGALYVAEAGTGGSGPIITGPALGVDLSYGTSGAVTRIQSDTQERVINGLPSFGFIPTDSPPPPPEGVLGPALGPQDIGFLNGDLYVAIGYGSDLSFSELNSIGDFDPAAADLGSITRFTLNPDEMWERRADFAANLSAFEQLNNPDGEDLISNPYALEVEGDNFLVVDAGANDLLRVDSEGDVLLESVFGPRIAGGFPIQSVPSSLALGPDGAYYVGEFTGFPNPEGEAHVYRVVPGSEPEIYADGFTQISGLDFDADGNLYVLEYSVNSVVSGDDLVGRLTMLPSDGSPRRIIVNPGEGLVAPSGIEVSPDGAIYISNFGVTAGQGEVVRIDPPTPVPEPSVVLGLLPFGVLGIGLQLKGKKERMNY